MEKKTYVKKLVLKKSIRRFINRIMIVIVIMLVALILSKKDTNIKKIIMENVYEKNFKIIKARELYSKYLGNILPIKKIDIEDDQVFNEKLTYDSKSVYKDGVVLGVTENYLVPSLGDGVVIYVGEKSDYGMTVIIEQTDGVDVFYSNIEPIDIKLYDYVPKGKLVGEAKDNKLYLVFSKEGKYLDYKDYI